MTPSNGSGKRIETKHEVDTYLERLKYSLGHQVRLEFQLDRLIDDQRAERFTNRFTMGDLFPNEDVVEVLKRELLTLKVENYIETVKDLRFPKRSEMRVFGKNYDKGNVYIKIRVESITGVDNHVFVMSFHYAEQPFTVSDFPYLKQAGE